MASICGYVSFEDLLADIQKWQHWSMKLLGYSVLSFSGSETGKGRKVTLKNWLSFSRWYPVLHVVFLFYMASNYIFELEEMMKVLLSPGSTTEFYIYVVNGGLSAFVGGFYRVLANVKATSMLHFWSRTPTLLEFMAQHGINFEEHMHLFQAFKRSSRKKLVLTSLSALLGVTLISFLYPMLSFLFGWGFLASQKPPPIPMAMMFAYFGITTSLSVCQMLWFSSFLGIYRLCVKILREDLAQLVQSTHQSNSLAKGVLKVATIAPSIMKPIDFSDGPKYEQKILNSLAIYYKIESHVRVYNKFFGPRIACEVLLYASYVLMYTFIFLVSINSDAKEQLILSTGIFTATLFSMCVYDLSSASTMLLRETNGLLSTLEELLLESRVEDTYLRQKLLTVILKIIGKPLEPAPGHFFTLNRGIITSIGSAIVTYLVVLVQFRSDDKMKSEIPPLTINSTCKCPV